MKASFISCFRRIGALFTPPVFPDRPDRTRQAGLLMPLLIVIVPVIIAAVPGIIFVFPVKLPSAAVIAAIALVLAVCLLLLRRGYVKAASIVYMAGIGFFIAGMTLFSGGIGGINIVYFVGVAVAVRLLLGTRASIIMVLSSIAFLAALAVLDANGIRPPRIFPVPPTSAIFMYSFAVALAVTTVHIAVKQRDEALAAARTEIEERRHMMDALSVREKRERMFTDRLKSLHGLVNELARTPSFDGFFRRAIDGARTGLGFTRLSVWLLADDGRSMSGTYGIDEHGDVRDERNERIVLAGNEPPARMLREGMLVHVKGDAPLRDGSGRIVGTGSNIAAPIYDGGRIIGAMCADDLLSRTPFDEHDVSTIALFAASVGHLYAIKRAETALHEYAEELVRSNQELKEFVSIVSHDLKEPMRTAASFAELFRKRFSGITDEKAVSYLDAITEETDRMQKLIDGLLSYARTGSSSSGFTDVTLGDVLREVLSVLQGRIDECGAAVTIGELPVIAGDATQLKQLFQNLIDNALKFRSSRPLAVDIRAEHAPEGWHITVADNGIGFDEAQAERVFLIFRRLVPREAYDGTGVGLAICRKVAARHGGRIWATAKPDAGAVFHIVLPEKRSHQERSL